MHNSKEHQQRMPLKLENPGKWNTCQDFCDSRDSTRQDLSRCSFCHSKISVQKLTKHCRKEDEKQITYPKLEIGQLRHVSRTSNARIFSIPAAPEFTTSLPNTQLLSTEFKPFAYQPRKTVSRRVWEEAIEGPTGQVVNFWFVIPFGHPCDPDIPLVDFCPKYLELESP